MKTTLLQLSLSIMLVVLSATVHAQNKKLQPAADRAAKLTGWMKTNLQLTADQEPKVQDINLKYANKVDELKNNSAGRRQKMKMLKDDDAAKDAELKAVLTDSQFQTYLTKKDEIKKKMKQKAKDKM